MNIFEELKKQENKKNFRELMSKHHPDKKGGSIEIAKKLNNAKDKGDEAFERFRDELLGKKPKETVKFDLDDEIKKQSDKYWGKKKSTDDRFEHLDEFVEALHVIKVMDEVKKTRTVNKNTGYVRPFWIDLKDGNHIQIEYGESPTKNPNISIWLLDSNGRDLAFKFKGKKYNSFNATGINEAIAKIKVMIEHSKDAYTQDWRKEANGNDD